jgi:hypothetical protein
MDHDDDSFQPTRVVDDMLDELEVPVPADPDEDVAGDFVSARSAADQLRRAGFRDVKARQETLEYRWAPDDFLEYKLHYAERSSVAGLDEDAWQELWRRSRERLAELEPEAFRWRSPVVFASGKRPA